MENKLEHLKNYLRELGSVAVAFSSGVDSTSVSLKNWRLRDFPRTRRTDATYVRKNCLRRLGISRKRMESNTLQRVPIWTITVITDRV